LIIKPIVKRFVLKKAKILRGQIKWKYSLPDYGKRLNFGLQFSSIK
jgi:hypothetical protein